MIHWYTYWAMMALALAIAPICRDAVYVFAVGVIGLIVVTLTPNAFYWASLDLAAGYLFLYRNAKLSVCFAAFVPVHTIMWLSFLEQTPTLIYNYYEVIIATINVAICIVLLNGRISELAGYIGSFIFSNSASETSLAYNKNREGRL